MGASVDDNDLRKAGLKATAPRLRILQLLAESGTRHVSAEDVYRSLVEVGDDIGLATIYRVLTQFEAAGLVSRHRFEDGRAVFELSRGEHHDHVICTRCGKVEEFFDRTIEERQRAVVQEMGFSIADHSLVIYGDCLRSDCPEKG